MGCPVSIGKSPSSQPVKLLSQTRWKLLRMTHNIDLWPQHAPAWLRACTHARTPKKKERKEERGREGGNPASIQEGCRSDLAP